MSFLIVELRFTTLPTDSLSTDLSTFCLCCSSKSTFRHKWRFCPERCPCVDVRDDKSRAEHFCSYLLDSADAASRDWIYSSFLCTNNGHGINVYLIIFFYKLSQVDFINVNWPAREFCLLNGLVLVFEPSHCHTIQQKLYVWLGDIL